MTTEVKVEEEVEWCGCGVAVVRRREVSDRSKTASA